MATYGKKSAHRGGLNQGAKRHSGGSGGKVMGASKAPLPKQKKATGSGIAGRGTRD